MDETTLVRTTPFACRETDRIVYDKAEQKSGVKAKIGTKFLKEPELYVIDILRRYSFLNAHMISQLLSRDIGYPKDAVKKLLSRMTKGKYVTRFRVAYIDAHNTEHRSSYIYTLADNIFNDGSVEILSRTAFSFLAFNQFHIAITQNYPGKVSIYYSKGRDTVDGSMSFTSEGKRVTINIVTVRKGPDSGTHAVEVLKKAVQGERVKGTLLILCESEFHALEIEQYRQSIDEVKDLQTFYLCDLATTGTTLPLENVVRIREGLKDYEICLLPVDDIMIG